MRERRQRNTLREITTVISDFFTDEDAEVIFEGNDISVPNL